MSNQLQLRAQIELKILSIYLQLGAIFPLFNWSHNDLFWSIMRIMFSVKWVFFFESAIFADTELHLLTPLIYNIGMWRRKQHTFYHTISWCKLQLSQSIKVFLYLMVIFYHTYAKWKYFVLLETLYVEKDPENNMLLSTCLDILWTLNNVFCKIKTCSFYRKFWHKYDRACIWDGIIYHFINFQKVWILESNSFNQEISAGTYNLLMGGGGLWIDMVGKLDYNFFFLALLFREQK